MKTFILQVQNIFLLYNLYNDYSLPRLIFLDQVLIYPALWNIRPVLHIQDYQIFMLGSDFKFSISSSYNKGHLVFHIMRF